MYYRLCNMCYKLSNMYYKLCNKLFLIGKEKILRRKEILAAQIAKNISEQIFTATYDCRGSLLHEFRYV